MAAPRDEDVRRRVQGFARWHYPFDFGGVKTPAPPGSAEWHAGRAQLVLEPLKAVTGGDLAGRRVLDLGCNAGYWSLLAVETGCKYVLGVDHQEMAIEQAELVFEMREIQPERFEFRLGDVYALDPATIGQFDVVLCLGLLYHVSQPVQLMAALSALASDFLVVDTQLVPSDASMFELYEDPSAAGTSFALRPSPRAVMDLAQDYGFEMMRIGRDPWHENYRRGRRGAFLGAKTTDLAPAEPWRHEAYP